MKALLISLFASLFVATQATSITYEEQFESSAYVKRIGLIHSKTTNKICVAEVWNSDIISTAAHCLDLANAEISPQIFPYGDFSLASHLPFRTGLIKDELEFCIPDAKGVCSTKIKLNGDVILGTDITKNNFTSDVAILRLAHSIQNLPEVASDHYHMVDPRQDIDIFSASYQKDEKQKWKLTLISCGGTADLKTEHLHKETSSLKFSRYKANCNLQAGSSGSILFGRSDSDIYPIGMVVAKSETESDMNFVTGFEIVHTLISKWDTIERFEQIFKSHPLVDFQNAARMMDKITKQSAKNYISIHVGEWIKRSVVIPEVDILSEQEAYRASLSDVSHLDHFLALGANIEKTKDLAEIELVSQQDLISRWHNAADVLEIILKSSDDMLDLSAFSMQRNHIETAIINLCLEAMNLREVLNEHSDTDVQKRNVNDLLKSDKLNTELSSKPLKVWKDVLENELGIFRDSNAMKHYRIDPKIFNERMAGMFVHSAQALTLLYDSSHSFLKGLSANVVAAQASGDGTSGGDGAGIHGYRFTPLD